MNKYYLCIDLKTFFASVECVERNLDPFKTDLVVADPERGRGTICLAISPKMKKRGIKNRCRFYEIPSYVKPIIAKPRMKKYLEYSKWVYSIYLKYISEDDIYAYSIDECFLDVTSYLKMYKLNPIELAKKILKDVLETTGLTASVGIGTNIFLTKVALDITAKHSDDNIGYLDEEKFKKELWYHNKLTDFWQIGKGIETRLHKLKLNSLYDVASCNEKILYKEFGVNAKYLINHAWGKDDDTISDFKNYNPKSRSLSNSQILYADYSYQEARVVLTEMLDNLVLQLIKKEMFTNLVGVYIGYSKDVIPILKYSVRFDHLTNNFSVILERVLEEYDAKVSKFYPIRKIGISFSDLSFKAVEQLDLFTSYEKERKDYKVENVMNKIKEKYGKNSILRGINLEECATQKKRNSLINGHNAE